MKHGQTPQKRNHEADRIAKAAAKRARKLERKRAKRQQPTTEEQPCHEDESI